MRLAAAALAVALVAGACASSSRPEPARPGVAARQRGKATWYGPRHHGRKTASGERFDMHALTAAHRSLPFGAVVRVTNLRNGRSVVVRINDRGPFGGGGRIIDVSREAARRLGMIEAGVVPVEIEVLSVPLSRPRRRR